MSAQCHLVGGHLGSTRPSAWLSGVLLLPCGLQSASVIREWLQTSSLNQLLRPPKQQQQQQDIPSRTGPQGCLPRML